MRPVWPARVVEADLATGAGWEGGWWTGAQKRRRELFRSRAGEHGSKWPIGRDTPVLDGGGANGQNLPTATRKSKARWRETWWLG
jgi:hypothetical protein